MKQNPSTNKDASPTSGTLKPWRISSSPGSPTADIHQTDWTLSFTASPSWTWPSVPPSTPS